MQPPNRIILSSFYLWRRHFSILLFVWRSRKKLNQTTNDDQGFEPDMTSKYDKAHWLAVLLPAALLAGAYASQYVGGLYPCEMCWWQRYPHFAAVAIAVIAFGVGNAAFRKILVALAALAIASSGIIGGYHAGVEYGWWEGLTACTATISGTGDDLLKSILNAPLVRCDVAPWTLFGISLAGYNFLLSFGGAALILAMIWRNKQN